MYKFKFKLSSMRRGHGQYCSTLIEAGWTQKKEATNKCSKLSFNQDNSGWHSFCWNGDCAYVAQEAGNFIGQKSNKLWGWMILSAGHFPCSLKVINATEVGVLSFLSDTSRILIAHSWYRCVNYPVWSFSNYLGFLAHYHFIP